MTSPDHTAPTCPSVQNEPKSKSFPYTDVQLYPLSDTQQEQLTDEMRAAGALFAITTIQGLLEYSESYKRKFRGKYNPICPWPLTPAQASGLHAALFHLHHYVGLLVREPGG
jgi:hypothetical protein